MTRSNPRDVSEAVASIKLAQAEAHLKDAQKTAERRSGARGAEARKRLLTAEEKHSEAEQRSVGSSQTRMGANNFAQF